MVLREEGQKLDIEALLLILSRLLRHGIDESLGHVGDQERDEGESDLVDTRVLDPYECEEEGEQFTEEAQEQEVLGIHESQYLHGGYGSHDHDEPHEQDEYAIVADRRHFKSASPWAKVEPPLPEFVMLELKVIEGEDETHHALETHLEEVKVESFVGILPQVLVIECVVIEDGLKCKVAVFIGAEEFLVLLAFQLEFIDQIPHNFPIGSLILFALVELGIIDS